MKKLTSVLNNVCAAQETQYDALKKSKNDFHVGKMKKKEKLNLKNTTKKPYFINQLKTAERKINCK